MSRDSLLEALASRTGESTAVVPLVGRYAAALEQVSEASMLEDPEVLARSLRNAQSLHGYDATTLGPDSHLIAQAAWLAGDPTLSPGAAQAKVELRERLADLPDPAHVIEAPNLAVVREAFGRLRPVLGERAGIALVLPDPASLAWQLRVPDSEAWATKTIIGVVRFFGTEQPDLFLIKGTSHDLPPSLQRLGDFFGAPLIHACASPSCPPGVLAVPEEAFAPQGAPVPDIPDQTWLLTTDSEIQAARPPSRVRTVLDGIRAGS